MTSYVCEHAECQAEGTEAMPAGERYCAEHAPEPLAMWSWGDDRFSPPYGKAGVEQAIAESMVQDLDNGKAGTVTGPDGVEYQINVEVTLTPVLVDAHVCDDRCNVPADFEVQPLGPDDAAERRTTCGTCGLSWDDAKVTSMTPAPSARCPFEAFHA